MTRDMLARMSRCSSPERTNWTPASNTVWGAGNNIGLKTLKTYAFKIVAAYHTPKNSTIEAVRSNAAVRHSRRDGATGFGVVQASAIPVVIPPLSGSLGQLDEARIDRAQQARRECRIRVGGPGHPIDRYRPFADKGEAVGHPSIEG